MIDAEEQLANLKELEAAFRQAIRETNEPLALSRLYPIWEEVKARIAEIEQ